MELFEVKGGGISFLEDWGCDISPSLVGYVSGGMGGDFEVVLNVELRFWGIFDDPRAGY